MICIATKKDGSPCKASAKDAEGLCIFHAPKAPKLEVDVMTPTKVEAPDGKPAFLQGLPRSRNPRLGQRRVKMLRPICREGCAGLSVDWWRTCPHDPYIGVGERRLKTPVYSEPREDGTVIVEGMEETVSWQPRPNWLEVTVSMKVNSGNGVARQRAKGAILVTELRSPAFPRGIAAMCEFRGCYWQHGLLNTRYGSFCKEIEAKRVAQDQSDGDGNPLYGATEILHGARMREQLDRIVI
jgi:hypothetical protein